LSIVKIDPQFEEWIQPLDSMELALLEESIRREGCRDPIRQWGDYIIDGHNRYRICKKWDIPYGTTPIELPDRDAALLWIQKNQLSRRNVNDEYRKYLVGAIAEAEAKRSRDNQLAEARKAKQDGGAVADENDRDRSKDARTKVAKQAGVSEHSLKQVKKIRDAVAKNDPKAQEVVKKLRDGKIKLAAAVKEIAPEEPKPSRHSNPHAELLECLRALDTPRFLDTIKAVPPTDYVREQILKSAEKAIKVITSIQGRLDQ
jgi:hypothetical protein